jgi:archaellum biogenesis ATPase FlaH
MNYYGKPNGNAQFITDYLERQEKTILATALYNPKLVFTNTVLKKLAPQVFADQDRARLWILLRKLYRSGGSYDLTMVSHEFTALSGAQAVTIIPGERVAYLIDLEPWKLGHVGTLERHAEELNRYALLRTLLESCERGVAAACSSPYADPRMIKAAFDQEWELAEHAYSNNGKYDPRADLVWLNGVDPKDVEWLWYPYLPLGMISLLTGDPDVGKTYIALSIASAVTTGRIPTEAEGSREPANVIYFYSAENPEEYVLRPRFDNVEGDSKRLAVLHGSIIGEGDQAYREMIHLEDLSILDNALEQTNARLIIGDPLQSYLGSEVDAYRANETRPILDKLARMAQKRKCVLLILRHPTKGSDNKKAIHRGMGSIDFSAAARSELFAGMVEDQRAIVHIKNNVGIRGPVLGYEIDSDNQFSWVPTSLTAEQVFTPEPDEEERSCLGEALDFLRQQLEDEPQPQKALVIEARKHGISWATVRRAKDKLKVQSRRQDANSPWFWELPPPINSL